MRFIAGTTLAMLIASAPLLAAGGGSMGGGSMGGAAAWKATLAMRSRAVPTPRQGQLQPRREGSREGKKAEAEAAAAQDPAKKQKVQENAQKWLRRRRVTISRTRSTTAATCTRHGTTSAYSQRKLGNYEAALAAYDQALTYSPAYGEAIEYRAEAYLAFNRLDDAKSAYLTLFRDARPLAAQLMATMQKWVEVAPAGCQGSQPGRCRRVREVGR